MNIKPPLSAFTQLDSRLERLLTLKTGGRAAPPGQNGRSYCLDCEDQQKRDEERENAESFGLGEAEDEATELTIGC